MPARPATPAPTGAWETSAVTRPGSHAGIVVLRLTDEAAATVTKAISDLVSLASLAGAVTVTQRGLLRIRHP